MAKEFKIKIGFDINKYELSRLATEIDKAISRLQQKKVKLGIDTDTGLLDAQISKLNKIKEVLNSFEKISNNTDAAKFRKEINSLGNSINGMSYLFKRVGIDSGDFFNKLNEHLNETRIEIKETASITEKFGRTISQALKWNIASVIVHGVEKFIKAGYTYIKDLDSSLNNIRIVTGASAEEMEAFSKSASEAAKNLGRTTKEYIDASLIFFQQGKSREEVKKLTEATLIAANITGQTVEETSELMTAILNGYSIGANKALEVVDKLAAVGAETGSSFKEIAIGFSKVASMGKIAGVTLDQLNAMIATISTVTRESPESIGTSLKAIFGRMTELKSGKEDEEGWTSGRVEVALKKIGLSLFDVQGNMKDLGQIIDELGAKWNNLNRESQLAISTALAGSRQQNRFIALMDNYSTLYQDALYISTNATDVATKQNEIRLESINAKIKQLKNNLESVWESLYNSKVMKFLFDGFNGIAQVLKEITTSLGSIGGFSVLGGLVAGIGFKKQIAEGTIEGVNNLKEWVSSKKQLQEAIANIKNLEHNKIELKNFDNFENNKKYFEHKKEQYKYQQIIDRKLVKKIYGDDAEKVLEENYIKLRGMIDDLEKKVRDLPATISDIYTIYEEQIEAVNNEIIEHQNNIEKIKNESKSFLIQDDETYEGLKSVVEKFEEKKQKSPNTGGIKFKKGTKEYEAYIKAGLHNGKNPNPEFVQLHVNTIIDKATNTTKLDMIKRELEKYKNVPDTSELEQEIDKRKELIKVLEQERDAKIKVKKSEVESAKIGIETEEEQIKEMTANAKKIDKVEKIVNYASIATVALPIVLNGFQQISEAQDTLQAKSEAWGNTISSLSMPLMMLPGYFKIAGVAALALGVIIKKIGESLDKVYQAQKRNNEILKQADEILKETNNKIAGYYKAKNAFIELQQLTKNGTKLIADLTEEELSKYEELSNLIAQSAPELVAYYDEQGKAIIDLTKNIDELIKKQREAKIEAYNLKTNNFESFVYEYTQKNLKYFSEKKNLEDKINSSIDVAENQEKLIKLKEEMEQNRNNFKENVLNNAFLGNEGINNILNSNYEGKQQLLTKMKYLIDNDYVMNLFNSNKTVELKNYINTLDKFYDAASSFSDVLKNKILNIDKGELLAIIQIMNQFGTSVDNINKVMEKFSLMSTEEFTQAFSTQDGFYQQIIDMFGVNVEDVKTKTEEEKKQIEEQFKKIAELEIEYNNAITKEKTPSNYSPGPIIPSTEIKKQLEQEKTKLEELSQSYAAHSATVERSESSYRKFIDSLLQTAEGMKKVYLMFNNNIDKIKELDQKINNAVDKKLIEQYEKMKDELVKSNAIMYDEMNENNEEYYIKWVKINAAQIAQDQAKWGVIATNYKTKAEYLQALEQTKAKGEVLITANSTELIAKYQQELTNFIGNTINQRTILVQKGNRKVVESYYQQAKQIAEIEYKKTNWIIRAWNYVSGKRDQLIEDIALKEYDKIVKELDTNKYKPVDDVPLKKLNLPEFKEPKLEGPKVGNNSGNNDNKKSDTDKLEKELDILHDLNIALKEQEAIIERLQKKEKELYGDELYKNLKRQVAALQEKKMILEAQMKLAEQEAANIRKQLSNKGVKFRENGDIANYNTYQQTLMNQVNSITNKDKFDKAKERAEEIFKLMEKYEEYHINIKIDKEKAIDEINSIINETEVKSIKLKLEVNLDLLKEKEENLDYLLAINDTLQDIDENYMAHIEKMELISAEMQKYKEMINEVKNTNLTTKDKLSLLDEYENKLMELGKNLKSIKDSYDNLNKKTLQEVNKLLNQQTDIFEDLVQELDFYGKALSLIAENKNYDLKNQIINTQNEIYMNEAKAISSVRDELIKYRDTLKEGTEQWYEVNKEIDNMNNKLENITIKVLENIKSEFNNTISKLTEEFERKMFNGKNYKEFKDEYDYLVKQQNKYLENEEKIVAIGNLQQKIEQQLNETYNERSKQLLQDFYDNQVKALKQKDKLTKYDVERAEKIYQITLKQMALEDAKNNKTMMKLVRDSQGNWSYQYVADTKKIADAQEALSKDLQSLMEFDKKQLEQTQQEMIQLKYQFIQQIQQIIQDGLNGQYKSQEEMYATIEDAQKRFNNEISTLEMERYSVSVNVSESTLATILDTYKNTKDELNILVPEQEKLLESLASQVGGTWTEISNTTKALLNGDVNYFKENYKLPIEAEIDNLKTNITILFKEISTNWTGELATMLGQTQTDMPNIQKEIETFKTNVEIYINNIKTAWEIYESKIQSAKETIMPQLSNIEGAVKNIKEKNDSLKDSANLAIQKIIEQLEQLKKVLGTLGNVDEIYKKIIENIGKTIEALDKYISKLKETETQQIRTNQNMNIKPTNPVPKSTTTPPKTSTSSGGSGSNGKVSNSGGSGSGGGSGSSGGRYNNFGFSDKEAKKLQELMNYVTGEKIEEDGYLGEKSWKMFKSEKFRKGYKTMIELNAHLPEDDREEFDRLFDFNFRKKVESLLLLPLDALPHFDTGGYTGDWLDNKGRLAVLHQKEIVLNKQDTQNILKSVEIVRSFADIFKFKNLISTTSVAPVTNTIPQQNIVINASFPNVVSSDEIKKAFMDLENKAAQYISSFKK